MRDYFRLQYVMTNRKIREVGVNPFFGYFLGLLVFFTFTEIVFQYTEFAKYLIILVCISVQVRISAKNRSEFLITTFGTKSKNIIRIIENLVVSIPFVSILLFKNLYFEFIILFLCSIGTVLFNFRTSRNFTIPTPFSKNPFEFATGFRRTFLIFPFIYILTCIAIKVDNFNLGIFSMLLILLINLSYYSKPEKEYYVWVHSHTPKSFLKRKIVIATKHSFLLILPIFIGLLFFYPGLYHVILLFAVIGILFLWTMILAKYSTFPSEINLPEGIIIAFALSFPPLILLIIPYFYAKSIRNLKLILND